MLVCSEGQGSVSLRRCSEDGVIRDLPATVTETAGAKITDKDDAQPGLLGHTKQSRVCDNIMDPLSAVHASQRIQ